MLKYKQPGFLLTNKRYESTHVSMFISSDEKTLIVDWLKRKLYVIA